LRPFFWVLRA